MLENDWAERGMDSIHVPIPSLFLNAIVDFLVNGALMQLDQPAEFYARLLIHADYLMIERLIEACQFKLKEKLTDFNSVDMLMLSETYNFPFLRQLCIDYISI